MYTIDFIVVTKFLSLIQHMRGRPTHTTRSNGPLKQRYDFYNSFVSFSIAMCLCIQLVILQMKRETRRNYSNSSSTN
jgi:hypothetical protein